MAKYRITIQETNERYTCADAKSLLEGMLALGKKGIPCGCRSGGCGVCKVQVVQGEYTSQVMSRAHVSEDEERDGVVLACRVKPVSAIVLSVIGKLRRRFADG
ncbi:MAG: 2Fe-2S iron-sulfur cluster binding domain-containing protein [Rhodocyclales bacterium]|nr:2Fe-2S iron-sulfur cluster binding domain-containing protein [Rhodocyclales bacterium]